MVAARPCVYRRGVTFSSPVTLAEGRPGVVMRAPGMSPAVRLLLIGTLLSLPFIACSIADVGGLRDLWDNIHWSLTALAASVATIVSVRGTSGRARAVRTRAAAAFALWLGANLTWAWLNAIHAATIPSVAD